MIGDGLDSLREYLASPAGRRMRRMVGGALILGSPLLFRVPGLRRHWALRLAELLGGAAILVALGERLRDWEPGAPPPERF
jgi:hypothetical protein